MWVKRQYDQNRNLKLIISFSVCKLTDVEIITTNKLWLARVKLGLSVRVRVRVRVREFLPLQYVTDIQIRCNITHR